MTEATVTEQTPEQRRAEQFAARLKAERLAWWQLRELYERCKAIAEQVWKDDLDHAQQEQEDLAKAMRDRAAQVTTAQAVSPDPRYAVKGQAVEVVTPANVQTVPLEIPVPLFTPRDRVGFIKEATVALLIEANRRNLTTTPEPKEPEIGAPQIES
jgi:hypothetical protein